ncbi:unnamed protein product, partial [Discosporangium mesarthrocarpum]
MQQGQGQGQGQGQEICLLRYPQQGLSDPSKPPGEASGMALAGGNLSVQQKQEQTRGNVQGQRTIRCGPGQGYRQSQGRQKWGQGLSNIQRHRDRQQRGVLAGQVQGQGGEKEWQQQLHRQHRQPEQQPQGGRGAEVQGLGRGRHGQEGAGLSGGSHLHKPPPRQRPPHHWNQNQQQQQQCQAQHTADSGKEDVSETAATCATSGSGQPRLTSGRGTATA